MEPRAPPLHKKALPKKGGLLPHRVVNVAEENLGKNLGQYHPTVVSGRQPATVNAPLNIGTRGITPEKPSLETQVMAKIATDEGKMEKLYRGYEKYRKNAK